MEKAATEPRLAAVATCEVETSLVAAKASTFPLERRVAVGSNGPDEDRQQIHGAVEAVENRPGDLTRKHREDIVDAEWDLEGLTQVNAET